MTEQLAALGRADLSLITMDGGDRRPRWRCTTCGREWTAGVSQVLRGSRCSVCVRRATLDQVLQMLADEQRDDLELVEYVGNTQSKSRWKCRAGHGDFWRPANEVIHRHGRCPKCSNARLGRLRAIPESELRERLAARGDLELLEYSGALGRPSAWRCTAEGHEWSAEGRKVLEGSTCPTCRAAARKDPRDRRSVGRTGSPLTEATIRDRLAARTDVSLLYYSGSASSLSRWSCPEGHQWEAAAGPVVRGTGCPRCAQLRSAAAQSLSGEEVRQRIAELGRDDLVELVFYAGAANDPGSEWRCRRCGGTWKARAGHVLKTSGQRSSSCPRCSHLRGGEKRRVPADQAALALAHRPDVELIDYAGTYKDKSTFRCTAEGHVWRTALTNVLKGSGCWECTGRGFPLPEEAVRARVAKRGDVEMLEYGGSVAHHLSTFRCTAAGHVWQTKPSNLLRTGVTKAAGCPACQTYGFNPGRPSWVYLLTNGIHLALKVGVTNTPDTRIGRQHRKNGWDTVRLWALPGWSALAVEERVIGTWRERGWDPALPAGLDGWTETVSLASTTVDDAIVEVEKQIRLERRRRRDDERLGR